MEITDRGEEKQPPAQSKKRKPTHDPFEDEYEDEAIPSEETPDARSFRFNRSNAFLTYPKCPIDPSQFMSAFEFRDSVKLCFAKQEKHADSTDHLHVFVLFTKKLDSRNPRCFDLTISESRYHPNIKKTRGRGKEDIQGIYEYLCKDGGTPTVLAGSLNLFPTSKDFLKRSRDFDAWRVYQYSRSCPDPVYPLRAPDGTDIPVPNPRNKRRHLWLHGPPSTYKTWWLISQVITHYRAYKCIAGQYTFDNYNGEQIIYWNDLEPKFEQLLDICDTYPRMRDAPSQTRYFQKQIPAGLVTLVIVTANRSINDMYHELPQNCRDALHERFIEYDMERSENQNFPRPE